MEIEKIERVVCFVIAIVSIIMLGNLIYRDIANLLPVLCCLTLVMAFLGVIDDDQ